jgi:hypothetical protein
MSAFGAALGLTTALSNVHGISSTLITTLFSFVGGVLLTYAGFRRVVRGKAGAEAAGDYDLDQVGRSLRAFSWSLVLAIFVGLVVRDVVGPMVDGLSARTSRWVAGRANAQPVPATDAGSSHGARADASVAQPEQPPPQAHGLQLQAMTTNDCTRLRAAVDNTEQNRDAPVVALREAAIAVLAECHDR